MRDFLQKEFKPSYNQVLIRQIYIVLLLIFSFISEAKSYQLRKADSISLVQLTDSAFNLHDVNHFEAVKLCNTVMEQSRASGSAYVLKNALYTSAYLDWFNGDHLKALAKNQESLILCQLTKDTLITAENYTLRGLIYLYLSRYDSSLKNFDKALETFKILKDTAQTLRNYGFIGLVYNKESNYVKARENLMEQVVLKRQFDSRDWNVIRFDDNAEHDKYFSESLINAKQNLQNYPSGSAPSKEKRFAYRNVALIYRELDKKDSSLYYFKKSVRVASKLKADPIWFDLAKAYLHLGMYDSAMWADEIGIEVAKKHGTRIILNYCYITKGHIYKAQNKLNLAINSYKEALSLDQQMGQKNAQMKIMLMIAKIYVVQKEYKQANTYVESALDIAYAIGARRDVVNALKMKYELLELVNDYKNAFKTKEIHDSLLDSLEKEEVQMNLAKIDLNNEVRLNQLEISNLNKQTKLSHAHLKNQNLVISIIVLVCFFIMLLLLLNYIKTKKLIGFNKQLYQQKTIISRQNSNLVKSNKEKEILLGEIHHRVKNNLQTITSLLNIQQRKLTDPDAVKVLEDSKNRVMAMGLIHQHIYQNSSFAEIDFKNYTKELVHSLIASNTTGYTKVICNIPALKISLDNAVFLGLIINELAINSIKYAFTDIDKPMLWILFTAGKKGIELEVRDNGNAKEVELTKANSFGWKMIRNICDKLEGSIKVNQEKGLSVKITFNNKIISLA